MIQYFHDVNAYVEENERYGSDTVKLELDEETLRLTVAVVDAYNNVVEDAPLVVDKTLDNIDDAVEFYEDVAHQLAQGDVIRHHKNKGEKVRSEYNHYNSRH